MLSSRVNPITVRFVGRCVAPWYFVYAWKKFALLPGVGILSDWALECELVAFLLSCSTPGGMVPHRNQSPMVGLKIDFEIISYAVRPFTQPFGLLKSRTGQPMGCRRWRIYFASDFPPLARLG